jgi:hypothetical protein
MYYSGSYHLPAAYFAFISNVISKAPANLCSQWMSIRTKDVWKPRKNAFENTFSSVSYRQFFEITEGFSQRSIRCCHISFVLLGLYLLLL